MDIAPKLSDIKNLHELSKVFAFPMIMVAYIAQTGWKLTFFDYFSLAITDETTTTQAYFYLIVIIIGKAVLLSFLTAISYSILIGLQLILKTPITPIIAMFFFVAAFLIAFKVQLPSQFGKPTELWAYTFFVIGFYFLSIKDPLDPSAS